MVEDAIVWLLLAGAATLLIAGATAPLATLAWWAGELAEEDDAALAPPEPVAASAAVPSAGRYIVYLGGVDTLDGVSHSVRERRLLDGLRSDLDDAVLVDTLFPYAVTGEPLLGEPRLLGWLWTALAPAPEAAKRPLLANLINARNFFQVLVSADRRYGPVYNRAIAEVVVDALGKAGWRPGCGARVTLLGYSGGAQMAAGAAARLAKVVDGPMQLVSLGGVMSAPDGLAAFARIDHLVARRDRAAKLAAAIFPARWPVSSASTWNRALASGRLVRRDLGDMAHNGADGYLGAAHRADAARPNWQVTLEAVRAALAAR